VGGRTHPGERDGIEDGKSEVDGNVRARVEEAGGVAGAGFLPGHLLGGRPWRGGVGGAGAGGRDAAEQRRGVAAVAVAVRPRHRRRKRAFATATSGREGRATRAARGEVDEQHVGSGRYTSEATDQRAIQPPRSDGN